tara:strand:+ start:158 stop:517 length:360 start_codon:yes stop_codon:yes gene_type:complete
LLFSWLHSWAAQCVGEKSVEFCFATAGSKAEQIIDEISLFAVMLSTEMILISHSPSSLSSLVPFSQKDHPAAEHAQGQQPFPEEEQPAADHAAPQKVPKKKCVAKEFLRSDLQGEKKAK